MLSILIAFMVLAPPQDGSQLYRDNCARCHGQDGNGIPGVDFRTGQFRRPSTDDDLMRIIAGGIPGTAMSPSSLPDAARRSLVDFLRSMPNSAGASAGGGDAARGRTVFEGQGGCTSCHRANGKGSRTGPDLGDAGSNRRAADIERSILNPNAAILPQNRTVRATAADGSTITGRRLNEDTDTIQLIDDRERLVSLSKATLREFTVLKTSPMPSFQGKLTPQELADVIAYLLSLKGPTP